MPEINYKITRTVPTVYLDSMDKAVNGYTVTLELPEYGETHTLNVHSLDPVMVEAAIKQLITWRVALSKLGSK